MSKITREKINQINDTSSKYEAVLEYYDDINSNVCLRITEERPISSVFEPFRISSDMIGGKGIESIVWPDREVESPTLANCCNVGCDKCRSKPSVVLLPLKPWKRVCDKFSYEHLYSQFCISDSTLVSLADSQQMSLENDRINDIESQIIEDLNNLDNYYVNGVKGQSVTYKSPNEAIYSITMEFVSKTKKYNKPQKKWRTNANDIYIIGSPQTYKELAGEDRDKFRTWFDNCVTPFKCENLNFISVEDIADNVLIIADKQAIKWGDQFNVMKSRELEDCLEIVYYKHFKIMGGIDYNYNIVHVEIEQSPIDEAEELKKKINEINTAINVADAVQATAEAEIKKKVDALKNPESTLQIEYEFSNFKAPTADEKGSIDLIAIIKDKDGTELTKSDKKNWSLTLFNEEANEIKSKFDSLTKTITIADAVQATAEAEIKKKVDALKNPESTLQIKYTYSEFSEPTTSQNGSISTTINIQDVNNTNLVNIPKTSWVINKLTKK